MAAPVDPDLLARARRGDTAAVESVLATMAATSRANRPRPSAWLWRLAIIAGLLGLVGFTLAVTSSSSGARAVPPEHPAEHGFPIGIVVGLVAGVGIGWTLGRARRG